jgi:hypothetical protein
MAAPDRFGQWKEMGRQEPTFPLTRVLDVDTSGKNDLGIDLPFLPRAIHVGTTPGNVKMIAGGVTIITYLEIGWHPISPTQIITTGTNAVGITAWD